MKKDRPDMPEMKVSTRLTRIGRPDESTGLVNPPIQRGSTILAPSAAELYDAPPGRPHYGRIGLSAQDALRDALTELQGGAWCALAPSGLSAMTLPLLTECQAGGEVLASDSLYGPVRAFLTQRLSRFGIRTRFFHPEIGAEIADLISDDTQAIFLESPGSLTMEIQDLPAIVQAAKARGVATMIDDTWSAGLTLKPLEIGIDYAAQALTKYVGGHSDLLMGAVIAGDRAKGEKLKAAERAYGFYVAPDEASLALRGLRTLELRMQRSAETSLEIARYLQQREEVGLIRHPALPGAPGHERWKAMFSGAAGLFSFEVPGWTVKDSEAFLNALHLFGIGYSWGGFESLAIHCDPQLRREASGPPHDGALIRLAIGLEAAEDLIADLDKGFAAVAAR